MTIPFGVTLRRLRIEKGLSQKQLADRLHMERSSVSNWEAGRPIPDAAVLFAANEESDETPNGLLVDDEAIILAGGLPILRQALPKAKVIGFTKPMQAVEFVREHPVALAFLDIELGRVSGLDLCRKMLRIRPHTNVIFLTAFPEYSLDAWDTRASGFLLKPLEVDAVKKQLAALRYPVGGLL